MKFYSTKRAVAPVELKQAVLNSLPADRGLYMPEDIQSLSTAFWLEFNDMPFDELSFKFAQCLLKDTVPEDELRKIVYQAINFDAPLIELSENLFCLELFHGPSLAFKDFGARFMARLMSYLVKDSKKNLDILVATSGDTGGAVALGFYNTPNINVTILYPSGKVSPLQEKQLTTLGHNIKAIEVDGTFDDCQRMVKSAFLDKELTQKFELSSANSINIARLIPQAFYYMRAFQQLKKQSKHTSMCVPSGNFGNITAGLIAKNMGLPIKQFIAANNDNNVFEEYLKTGEYNPRPSVPTYSNAMDVGDPSNFQRIMDLYYNQHKNLKQHITSYSYNNEQTVEAIKEVYQKYQYIVCPHTAVAYLGAKEFLEANPYHQVIFQATAHPAKFLDVVEDAIQEEVPIPERLAAIKDEKKVAIPMSTKFEDFKDYLLKR